MLQRNLDSAKISPSSILKLHKVLTACRSQNHSGLSTFLLVRCGLLSCQHKCYLHCHCLSTAERGGEVLSRLALFGLPVPILSKAPLAAVQVMRTRTRSIPYSPTSNFADDLEDAERVARDTEHTMSTLNTKQRHRRNQMVVIEALGSPKSTRPARRLGLSSRQTRSDHNDYERLLEYFNRC